jgi:hypothetical protein
VKAVIRVNKALEDEDFCSSKSGVNDTKNDPELEFYSHFKSEFEFFNRSKGTLPEVITPSELEKLNSALISLFAPLRKMRSLYQQPPLRELSVYYDQMQIGRIEVAKDGTAVALDANDKRLGQFPTPKAAYTAFDKPVDFLEIKKSIEAEREDRRLAICVALNFYCRFIQLFQKPLAEELDVPILHLIDALAGLNRNSVASILKPTRARGNPPSSDAHRALKGLTAATVMYLTENSFSAPDAHKTVAKWLNELGLLSERGDGDITAHTVRNWCNEVSSDVGRKETAAIMYDKMVADSERQRLAAAAKNTTPEHAALCRLILWVNTNYAALKKSS